MTPYSMEVFFDTSKPFDQVLNLLEREWTIAFERSSEFSEATYEGFRLSIIVVDDHEVCDHKTVDNIAISFSKYKYEILIKTYVRGPGCDDLVQSFAFWIAYQLYGAFKWPCIVVALDGQELLLELGSPG